MLKYVSGCTQKEIVLSENKIRAHIKTSGLYNKKWKMATSYVGESYAVTDISMEPREYTIKIDFLGSKEERSENVEIFLAMAEQDIFNKIPGQLYLNNQYLNCFIIGSDYKQAGQRRGVQNTIQVYAPNPFWCENKMFYIPKKAITGNEDAPQKLYGYSYPYTYVPTYDITNIINEHYTPVDFEMIIYGPAINPTVTIDGHIYSVSCELLENEKMVINSFDKKVYKTLPDGTMTSLYDKRNREYYIFQRLPNGILPVVWNGTFSMECTLLLKRSEPKWN